MYYVMRLKAADDCKGCRLCILSCPEGNAIRLIRRKGKKAVIEVEEERCKGCEICIEVCPCKCLEAVLR